MAGINYTIIYGVGGKGVLTVEVYENWDKSQPIEVTILDIVNVKKSAQSLISSSLAIIAIIAINF